MKISQRNNHEINKLHTKFQIIIKEFLRRCKNKNINLLIYCSYRTFKQQAGLYAKGRTTPGKKVTNAKPGQSFHNYKLAIDVCEVKNGKCLWSNPNWKIIAKIGKELGLTWGGDFKSIKDKPHFQYTGGLTLKQIQEKHKQGKDLLDHIPTPDFTQKIKEEKKQQETIKKKTVKKVIKKTKDNVIEADFETVKKLTKYHPIIQTIITVVKNLFMK